jgi:hypothetical protein
VRREESPPKFGGRQACIRQLPLIHDFLLPVPRPPTAEEAGRMNLRMQAGISTPRLAEVALQ